ncbi:hypothetical protein PV326_011868, partial [Microctonus aethiopoides]
MKMWMSIPRLLLIVYGALGFNLESRIPIVKHGMPGSYFGYSIAEHQELVEDPDAKTISWLLVGAPLGQNKQPGTNKSGALWKCPLTTYTNDCTQVITDGRLTEDGLIDP